MMKKGKGVVELDAHGQIIHQWPSIRQAALDIPIAPSALARHLRGETALCAGRTFAEHCHDGHIHYPQRPFSHKNRPVEMLTPDGSEVICTFDTITAAAASIPISPNTLRKHCIQCTVFRGHRWRYKRKPLFMNGRMV